jgi:hypothetical protein
MVSGRPVEVVSHAKLLKQTNDKYCIVQLRRARVSVKEIVQFYCTCTRPVLEYAAPVFHHALPKYLEVDFERIQKRSLSIIYNGAPYKENLYLMLALTVCTIEDKRYVINYSSP